MFHPFDPASPGFLLWGVCDFSYAPFPRGLSGLRLALWEAMLVVGLGPGFVVISQLSVLVQRDKQRSLYTFYIMTNTYCKTLLLPNCWVAEQRGINSYAAPRHACTALTHQISLTVQ